MTTWSGLYNGFYTDGQTAIGVGLPTDRIFNSKEWSLNKRMKIAKTLRKRGADVLGQLIFSLAGVAPGATASLTYRQIPARAQFDLTGYGGQVPISTITEINRATTADDQAMVQDLATHIFGPTLVSGYPVDRSGNGGGGKVGRF